MDVSEEDRYFVLFWKKDALQRDLRELELMRAVTPLERESQVRQLLDIRERIAVIDAQMNAPETRNETTKQRNTRLQKRRKELRAAGVANPTQILVVEFGISDSLVRRILRGAKPKPKKPGGILR